MSHANAAKTRCKSDHSLHDAYILGTGKRRCRECHRLRGKQYYAENRDKVLQRQQESDRVSGRKHRRTVRNLCLQEKR